MQGKATECSDWLPVFDSGALKKPHPGVRDAAEKAMTAVLLTSAVRGRNRRGRRRHVHPRRLRRGDGLH